jgi:phosphoglycolate phosphatase-like HAD superfamily hydrolase
MLARILPRLGIDGLFEAIVPGDAVSRGKPDPEMFIRAFRLLGVEPVRGIVVGDSEYDVVPARRIGATAILVLNGRKLDFECFEVKPDLVIGRIAELGCVLSRKLYL